METLSGKEIELEELCSFVSQNETSFVCFDQSVPEELRSEQLGLGKNTELMAHLQDEINQGVSDLREILNHTKLDLLEVCAPQDSPLSEAVRNAGGRALSLGLHNGFDLSTRQGFLKAVAVVRDMKPRYVHISPPCWPWSSIQNCNQRTEKQKQDLYEKRCHSKRLLKNCRKLIEVQLEENLGDGGLTLEDQRHAGGEHPLHAQSWSLSDMRHMVKLCGPRFAVHGCRHGMSCDATGELVKKPWGWFSTHDGVKRALNLVCNHGVGKHKRIEGNLTARSAVYPYLLCRRFAKALMEDSQNMSSLFSILEERSQVFAADNPGDENMDGDENPPENEHGDDDREPQNQEGDVSFDEGEIKGKLENHPQEPGSSKQRDFSCAC